MHALLTKLTALLVALSIVNPVPKVGVSANEVHGWNFNGTKISQNETRAQFHTKQVNFLDVDDAWKPIDTSFSTTTDGFVMNKATFSITAPFFSDGQAIAMDNNRFDIGTKKKITDPTLSMAITALGVTSVQGHIETGDLITPEGYTPNVSYVVYPSAYPTGDLIYYAHFGSTPKLEKLIRFNSKPSVFSYQFNMQYSTNDVKVKTDKTNKTPTNLHLDIPRGEGLDVFSSTTPLRSPDINEILMWDSTPFTKASGRNITTVSSTLDQLSLNTYLLTKNLPSSFFDTAIYPVYTDTTFFAGAGDGRVGYTTSSSWATTHDAGTGTTAQYTAGQEECGTVGLQAGLNYSIQRGFFPVDTSGIGSGNTVTAGSLNIKYYNKGNGDNDGEDYIAVVQTSQASTASLATSDYSLIGTTEGSSQADISSISTGVYTSYTLNATGLGWVNITGTSMMGVREGHDILNHTYAGSAGTWNETDCYLSEFAGTSNDPYLDVTYSATPAGSTYQAPQDMLIFSLVDKVRKLVWLSDKINILV